ncbi:MAG: DtxR family transcriptional regulator [Proteobacteria bacterium]|nr:DtxR family transcriptional regulator [Pseudomonadota bacterium]
MSNFFYWFWPVFSFLLAVLWFSTVLRLRRKASAAQTSEPRLTYKPTEAEDVLKIAYSLKEAGHTLNEKELARSVGLPGGLSREVAGAIIASKWAEENAQGVIHLTKTGEARARELIRAHRLWERYLVDRKGIPLEAIHAEADRHEHEMTPQEMKSLDVELGYPAWDPHGHAIPAHGSKVPSPQGHLLSEVGTPGSRLRILSLDDEQAPLLAQLIALGLKPGVVVEVMDQESDLLRLRLDSNIIPLAIAAARHVSVIPAPALAVQLGELPVGSRARIVEIEGSGKHQRRMLDMGFVPGAEVTVIRKAPLNDPTEYHVKDTAVALRQKDANSILVEELGNG